MEESIFTPIFIGFVVNVALFFVARYGLKRNFRQASRITLIAGIVVGISSFIVSGWQGIGIGVISLGMCICTLLLYVLSFLSCQER